MEPGLKEVDPVMAEAFRKVGAYDASRHPARNRDSLHGLLGSPIRCLMFRREVDRKNIPITDRTMLEAQLFTERRVCTFLGIPLTPDLKELEDIVKHQKEIDTMAKAEAAKKEKKARAAGTPIARVGIVQCLKDELIKARDNDRPVTADQLHAKLVSKFPDRSADSMKTTVRNQVGYHLGAKGFEVDKFEDEKKGLLYAAAKGASAEPKARATSEAAATKKAEKKAAADKKKADAKAAAKKAEKEANQPAA